MKIEVSIGEVLDKLSILEIKTKMVDDLQKKVNITKEYEYLKEAVISELSIDPSSLPDYEKLYAVNSRLWQIEDRLRVKEKTQEFDEDFITHARLVYINNDERAKIKKEINVKYNSNFTEEKSYKHLTQ